MGKQYHSIHYKDTDTTSTGDYYSCIAAAVVIAEKRIREERERIEVIIWPRSNLPRARELRSPSHASVRGAIVTVLNALQLTLYQLYIHFYFHWYTYMYIHMHDIHNT